jgi:hypothetical protein
MIPNTLDPSKASGVSNISVASDFSRYPAGRYKTDGPFSGEKFRDDVLVPLLKAGTKVLLHLDGTLGYGSSFLEETFGGLVRVHAFDPDRINSLLTIQSSDPSLAIEIRKYIIDAAKVRKQG